MDDTTQTDDPVVVNSPSPDGTEANILLSLEELIKSNITNLEKLREELKKTREMFEDSFNNDPTYREQNEKVKDANKQKSTTRQNIVNQPSVLQLNNKIKSMRSEIKERQMALSDYLKEYQRMTGATEIEVNDEIREIVSELKLVKRSGK